MRGGEGAAIEGREVRQAEPIPYWVNVAQGNENVAKVLRLLGNKGYDWVNFNRIYQVVKDDVGGISNILQGDWESQPVISRFKHTANSVG